MRRILVLSLVVLFCAVGLAGGQAHYQGCNITTNVAKVCRAGPGVFYAVTINFKGASGNYTYIWDAVDTTKIQSTTPVVILDTTTGPLTVTYNMMMVNGVVVNSMSGTIANLTITTE